MDPAVGALMTVFLQAFSEYLRQQGLTNEQINQYFMDSWQKVQDRPASDLPDVDDINF